MSIQHQITESKPLLSKEGYLTEPGYATSLLPVYSRKAIKASTMRIKEWDYYVITDGHVGLALTVSDNGYLGLMSARMNKNKKFQKEQLNKEGYEEIQDFYKERIQL